ncbi:hypothetical protein BDQ17DRAFT_1436779 [Cyathus striatus]|nr:hypothetical protein BDQ17DRAFT_1436779 [Cyathus striatus]
MSPPSPSPTTTPPSPPGSDHDFSTHVVSHLPFSPPPTAATSSFIPVIKTHTIRSSSSPLTLSPLASPPTSSSAAGSDHEAVPTRLFHALQSHSSTSHTARAPNSVQYSGTLVVWGTGEAFTSVMPRRRVITRDRKVVFIATLGCKERREEVVGSRGSSILP